MLIRIVRMGFDEDKVPDFLEMFDQIKDTISSFEGCHGVNLYRDSQQTNIYYTHSEWTDEVALNHYRNSDFFKGTWKKTKVMFSEKPQAYSLIEPDQWPVQTATPSEK